MTETATGADTSSSTDSADTSMDAAPVQADTYDEGDSDYGSLPDYGEIGDLDEGDTDYDSLPDYGADSDLDDPALSYDELPDPAAEVTAEPQSWEPGETVQVHGEGSSPVDSDGHDSAEVEAARADVEQALEQGARQDEAREAVDAAYAQAEADGLPANTKEQFEADAERAIDEAPSDTGAEQVEYKAPDSVEEAELLNSPDESPDAYAELAADDAASMDPDSVDPQVDQPTDSESEPAVFPPDDGRRADIDAARADVNQAHQEQDARAAVAEALGGAGQSDNGGVEQQVAASSDASGSTLDRATAPGSGTESGADLTPAELSALQDYTAMAYEPLNSALWRGSVDDVAKVADLSHDLSAALEKLPTHEGQVIRGSEPGRPIEAYDLSRYEPGERVVESGYISTTTNPDGLLQDFDGPVAWVIESKSGRDVSSVSSVSGESEVLFDRFTAFTVLSKEFDPTSGPDGTWIIYMEEEPRN